jgi:cell wall-associated NlpC family hydrolase
MLEIPDKFFHVKYVAARIPSVENASDLRLGANCQLFVYEILRHFGHVIPAFRSSDLWGDEVYTCKVSDFCPLDLMLYHHKLGAYGAHLGVYIGKGKVLHLAQRAGKPEIMNHTDFASMRRYAYFIGAKRLKVLL